jgi:DNA repair protein RadC
MIYRYASLHLSIDRELESAADLPNILRGLGLHDQTQEVLWVIAYDSMMQVRTIVEVARGGYHSLDVPIPALMTAVLMAGTDRFMIAHNHSAGDVSPTEVDIDLTRKVMSAANTCGLYFEDHIILSPGDDHYSMADTGILVPSKELRVMAQTNRKARVS